MRAAYRIVVLGIAAALLLSYYAAGSAGALGHGTGSSSGGTPSACSSSITIGAFDSLTWNLTAIPYVCKTTTFTVVNTGTTPHTFTVSNLANETDPSTSEPAADWAGFNPPDLYYSEPLNSSGTPGSTLVVTITFGSAPAAYEFTCIPHYSLGMHGMIYVLEGAPTPAPPIQPYYWVIIGGIATLGVITVVAAIIYGRRGARAEHEQEQGEGPGAEEEAVRHAPPALRSR